MQILRTQNLYCMRRDWSNTYHHFHCASESCTSNGLHPLSSEISREFHFCLNFMLIFRRGERVISQRCEYLNGGYPSGSLSVTYNFSSSVCWSLNRFLKIVEYSNQWKLRSPHFELPLVDCSSERTSTSCQQIIRIHYATFMMQLAWASVHIF